MQETKEALDNATIGKAHWRAWFSAAMGIFLDGFDLFIIAVALPLLNHYFDVSAVDLGLIGAAAPVGCIFGSAFFGRFTDRLGRRAILLFDIFFFVVFAGLSALAWSVTSLIVFRFLLGIGIGADYPVSSAYLTETMPKRIRGRMIVGGFAFQALGALVGAGLGIIILTFYPEPDAWRYMLGAGIVPAIIVLWLRANLPESPRWLIEKGEHEKASKAAEYMTGKAINQAKKRAIKAAKQSGFIDLFSPRYFKRTVLTSVSWFLMDIAFYGVGFFTPMILAAMPFTGGGDDYIARDIAACYGAAFIDLFLVLGIVIAVFLVERWGRIRLQKIGFLGMSVGLFILAGSTYLTDHAWHMSIVFSGFILFNILVNMGPNPTTFLLPAELFPTHLRATGHGFASASGKVGAAVGIFCLPVMKESHGLAFTMGMIGIASLLGYVLTAWLGDETKGKSIDEIDEVESAMDEAEVELLQVQRDIQRLNADIHRVEAALSNALEGIKRLKS